MEDYLDEIGKRISLDPSGFLLGVTPGLWRGSCGEGPCGYESLKMLAETERRAEDDREDLARHRNGICSGQDCWAVDKA